VTRSPLQPKPQRFQVPTRALHCLLLCLCATMRYSVCFAVVGIAVLAHTSDAKPMLSRRTNDVWEGKCEDHCECTSTALETTNPRHNRAQAACIFRAY
jgi:hypothetical protein